MDTLTRENQEQSAREKPHKHMHNSNPGSMLSFSWGELLGQLSPKRNRCFGHRGDALIGVGTCGGVMVQIFVLQFSTTMFSKCSPPPVHSSEVSVMPLALWKCSTLAQK